MCVSFLSAIPTTKHRSLEIPPRFCHLFDPGHPTPASSAPHDLVPKRIAGGQPRSPLSFFLKSSARKSYPPLSNPMSIRSLSQPYSLTGTPSTQVDRVDTRIFQLTYYMHCMGCSFCNDICCQYGVDVDLDNVARLQAAPEELEQFVGRPRSQWFQNQVVLDPEYPGGGYRRTQVIDGRCVFLNRNGRGCLVHSWCLQQGIPYQHLKPMILKDVASDIGMHESTISRVTTNKYVHTPVGIFELKYFFNSSISAADGTDALASEAVKEKIRQMVKKEDPKNPLSDQKIVELLRNDNIEIARRTVANYRDMLGIL